MYYCLVLPKAHSTDAAEEAESDLFKSELWTTLFRGGYKIGKLQRSLSGKHVSLLSIHRSLLYMNQFKS